MKFYGASYNELLNLPFIILQKMIDYFNQVQEAEYKAYKNMNQK